jgi:hypothetical protein
MNFRELKRLSLMAFIGFLILTALIAIVSVLTGKFGELQWKILATTLTISAASIVLLIAGMWPEFNIDEYWKTTASCGVLALAFAHAFLLALPDLDPRHKWVQILSPIFIGILTVQIIAAFWGEIENEWYYRFLALVAIVVGLQTLVIPILMKLRKGDGIQKSKLVLSPIEGDLYRDPAGKTYRVMEIETETSTI